MFWVYIIKSIKNGRYYVGQTNNIKRRIIDHNRGKDHSSKIGMPWVLQISKLVTTRKDAMRLEKSLKKLKSRERIEQFIHSGVEQSGSSSGS